MHYGSVEREDDGTCLLRWRDLRGNTFNRRGLDARPKSSAKVCRVFPNEDRVSDRDKSRVLQYYAREAEPGWGFFQSLNTQPFCPTPECPPWRRDPTAP